MSSEPHRAGRVPIDPQAFTHDGGGKRKRPRTLAQDHLKFVRGLPCLICLTRNAVQAAHLRAGNPVYAKRSVGLGEKPDDRWSLPLCAAHHAEQHRGNELAFWKSYGIDDPFAICLAIYNHSRECDEEAAELVVRLARR